MCVDGKLRKGCTIRIPSVVPPQYNDFDLCCTCLEQVIKGNITLPQGMELKGFSAFKTDKERLIECQFENMKLKLDQKMAVLESVEKRLVALEAVSHKQPSMEDMFRLAHKVVKEEADRQARAAPGFGFHSQPSIQPFGFQSHPAIQPFEPARPSFGILPSFQTFPNAAQPFNFPSMQTPNIPPTC